jgi:hypothetical protein
MTAHNWINPHDEDCPPAIAKVGLPLLKLASAIIDEMPDCPQKWAAALAIGANNLAGRPLATIAAKCNTTELALLKAAVAFCQCHRIHPSPYLRRFAADRAKAKRGGEAGTECHSDGKQANR